MIRPFKLFRDTPELRSDERQMRANLEARRSDLLYSHSLSDAQLRDVGGRERFVARIRRDIADYEAALVRMEIR